MNASIAMLPKERQAYYYWGSTEVRVECQVIGMVIDGESTFFLVIGNEDGKTVFVQVDQLTFYPRD